jgi:hypothetical protein
VEIELLAFLTLALDGSAVLTAATSIENKSNKFMSALMIISSLKRGVEPSLVTGYPNTIIHGITTQKTLTAIFTAVNMSVLHHHAY